VIEYDRFVASFSLIFRQMNTPKWASVGVLREEPAFSATDHAFLG